MKGGNRQPWTPRKNVANSSGSAHRTQPAHSSDTAHGGRPLRTGDRKPLSAEQRDAVNQSFINKVIGATGGSIPATHPFEGVLVRTNVLQDKRSAHASAATGQNTTTTYTTELIYPLRHSGSELRVHGQNGVATGGMVYRSSSNNETKLERKDMTYDSHIAAALLSSDNRIDSTTGKYVHPTPEQIRGAVTSYRGLKNDGDPRNKNLPDSPRDRDNPWLKP